MIVDKSKQKLQLIPVSKIVPNPAQPRRKFNSDELCSLADSIVQNGLIQPIIVRKAAGNEYMLIAGERRLRAAKIAGMRDIQAIITDFSSKESAVIAVLENLQRKDLSVFEEAFAVGALTKEWGLTQDEAAKKLGMSQSALANKLRILRLTPTEQKLIEENKLTERHARSLLRLNDSDDRMKVLEAVIKNGLNVKKTEELIDKIMTPQKKRVYKGSVPKDIRLFINTIDHAVSTMLTAGIDAKAERKETDDYIECIVRIPKKIKAASIAAAAVTVRKSVV